MFKITLTRSRVLPSSMYPKVPLSSILVLSFLVKAERIKEHVSMVSQRTGSFFHQYAEYLGDSDFIAFVPKSYANIPSVWRKLWDYKFVISSTTVNLTCSEEGDPATGVIIASMSETSLNFTYCYFLEEMHLQTHNFSTAEIITTSDLIYERMHMRKFNFSGVTIRPAVIKEDANPSDIEQYLNSSELKMNIVPHWLEKISIDTFSDLCLMFKFRYRIAPVKDGDKALLEDDADMTLYLRTVTAARFEAYAVLQPIRKAMVKFFFKKPSINSLRNIHMKPFRKETRYMFLGTCGILYLTAVCIYLTHRKYQNNNVSGVSVPTWVIGILTGKSAIPLLPNCRTSLIITFFGSLFSVVVLIFYGDGILVELSSRSSPIKTLENLKQYGYHFTTFARSDTLKGILLRAVKFEQIRGFIEKKEQICHLQGDRMATVAYIDMFYEQARKQNLSASFLCRHYSSVDARAQRRTLSAFMLQKNSEFTEFFNYGIIRIKETGLSFRYFNEVPEFRRGVRCDQEHVHETVRMYDVPTPFGIVTGGIVLSFTLMVVEKVWIQYRSFRQ